MSAVLAAQLALVAVANAVSFFDLVKEEWTTYKLVHKKTYSCEMEDKYRLKIWAENKNHVVRHNALYAKKEVTYQLAENPYMDMLHHEFVDMMCGYNRTARQGAYRRGLGYTDDNSQSSSLKGTDTRPATFMAPANNGSLPDTVDWRKEGAVTDVKDQGRCGACWAFSATGALEGQHYRKTGQLVSLSEQNLIDCTTQYGNNGCGGGFMDISFKYVKENNGINTEKSYPYEANNGYCRYSPANKGAYDVGYTNLRKGDEEMLRMAVGTVGPVSVAIDASQPGFQFYSKGVYHDNYCSKDYLDHAALVVGYGTDPVGGDYWLVKNSWGSSWGDNGYIMMARNKGNQCGIASTPSYPLV